ncbi:hypothetical protein GSF24_22390, partial [Microbispora triticiradicis]|nr:hypothetical protein [Microbispora triticiradicis]
MTDRHGAGTALSAAALLAVALPVVAGCGQAGEAGSTPPPPPAASATGGSGGPGG